MSSEESKPTIVEVDQALVERMLADVDRIVDGATAIAQAVTALVSKPIDLEARQLAQAVTAPEQLAGEPRVWDLTEAALENYDAEALVALRRDHRGDRHEVEGCRTCEIVLRRLGSLDV